MCNIFRNNILFFLCLCLHKLQKCFVFDLCWTARYFFISSPRIPSFLNACHQFLIVLYALNNILDTSVMVFSFSNRWHIASIFTFLFGLPSFLYASATFSVVFTMTCHKSIPAISVFHNLFFANLFWRRYKFQP